MARIESKEDQIIRLLKKIAVRLKRIEEADPADKCHHDFSEGPYFNMCNSYMQCRLCGKRKRC